MFTRANENFFSKHIQKFFQNLTTERPIILNWGLFAKNIQVGNRFVLTCTLAAQCIDRNYFKFQEGP